MPKSKKMPKIKKIKKKIQKSKSYFNILKFSTINGNQLFKNVIK